MHAPAKSSIRAQVPDLVSDHIHNQEFEEVLNRCRSSVGPLSRVPLRSPVQYCAAFGR